MTIRTGYDDDYPADIGCAEMNGLEMNVGDYRWRLTAETAVFLEFFGLYGIIQGDPNLPQGPFDKGILVYPARNTELQIRAGNPTLVLGPDRSS